MKNDYVIFEVDSFRFALPSHAVDRVERAVLLTPVPDAPEPVLGVLNDGGDVVPVLGLRRRIGGEDRDIIPSDRLLFSYSNGRRLALQVDSISDVCEILPEAVKDADEIWPGVTFLKSFAGLGVDVVLVQDIGAVLDPDQERDLDAALKALADNGDASLDG